MFMSVLTTLPEGVDVYASWQATSGSGVDIPAGVGRIGGRGHLYFALSSDPLAGGSVMGCDAIQGLSEPLVLRLDEVAFPVGAVAHRHTHAGAGWRHLVSGCLRIETDHGSQVIQAGTSWFEPSNSPVRAVALQTEGETRFVRCMVIPKEYEGRSTFRLCDPKDAGLPRLQVTHRHFDHIL